MRQRLFLPCLLEQHIFISVTEFLVSIFGSGLDFFLTDVQFCAIPIKTDPFIFNCCRLKPEFGMDVGLSFMKIFFFFTLSDV